MSANINIEMSVESAERALLLVTRKRTRLEDRMHRLVAAGPRTVGERQRHADKVQAVARKLAAFWEAEVELSRGLGRRP